MNIKSHWEDIQGEADDYDALIPKLTPYYHELNNLIINLITIELNRSIRILDLGGGTGNLALLVLKAFPNSEITVFDIAEKMLEICKQKLEIYNEKTDFIQGDFSADKIGGGYDLFISSLAIHHLGDKDKKDIFRKIYDSLSPGGTFLNRDIVLEATPTLTKEYEKLWRRFKTANGNDADFWFYRYLEEDLPATVESQIEWLKDADFNDVGCHWRHLNFAIFGGRKRRA